MFIPVPLFTKNFLKMVITNLMFTELIVLKTMLIKNLERLILILSGLWNKEWKEKFFFEREF